MFSADFTEHCQAYLEYRKKELFTANDTACYWESDRFFINTKRYEGFSPSIAKVIEIRDTELVEIKNAPVPIKQIYNDSKTYKFEDYAISMASPFMMKCKSQTSGETIWKLKLNAYLYTEIEERNGVLYFGTAGKGGRFYGVYLASGEVAFDYNTGGTERYGWYKGNVLMSNRKYKPVLISPKDGSEVRQIDIGEFKLTVYQYMLIKDDRLYAIASGSDTMYALCVDL